jgi:hypothetical protein
MVFVETVDEFIEKVKQLYQQDPKVHNTSDPMIVLTQ